MSKFNTTVENSMKTVNKSGYAAYSMTDKDKLISQVLTSFFNEKKFYGDNSEEIVETLKRVISVDPKFVSNLAIFARREFNMRSISHVILGWLAKCPEGKPFVKRTLKNIVLRGDDATEILAYYLTTFGKPIPNSLRKGLRDILGTFDPYTLAKYKGDGNSVKMRDLLCLCHPTPKNDSQSEIWKKLLEGTLESPYTWEVELSAKGNNKETWEALIDSGKVGYMALLRNLRNILNAEPGNIQKVFDEISDPEAVRKSRQLPFRYLSAYRSIYNACYSWNLSSAYDAIEKAADLSVENLPKIPGKTIIAIDVSGSMSCSLSTKSDIKCSDISTLFGVIANRICEKSMVFTFDTRLEELHIPYRNGIIFTALSIRQTGGGTNMSLPIRKILNDQIKADRMIIISDNECNHHLIPHIYNWFYSHNGEKQLQSLVDQYRREINPDFWIHAIDLLGYGTQQFIGSKTNLIAGWSEKVFEFIKLAEDGTDLLRKRIENYEMKER